MRVLKRRETKEGRFKYTVSPAAHQQDNAAKEVSHMKQKAKKIISISMITVTVLWLIAIVCIYIAAQDDAWGMLGFVILLPYSAIFLIGILCILGSIRGILAPKEGTDRILSRFTVIAASVFGFLAIISMVLPPILDEFDSPMFDMPYLGSVFSRMFFAFAALGILSALIGSVFGIMIRKLRSDDRTRLPFRLRTTAICVVSIIMALVLLVPSPAGSYNDGGSKIYEAVLYDIVDWNRTQHFDGTPFHEDGQRMRVYFCPENCYDYNMRWNLRH